LLHPAVAAATINRTTTSPARPRGEVKAYRPQSLDAFDRVPAYGGGVRNNKVIGEIVVPIDPPAQVRPTPNALVVEPESDEEVEVGHGHATLSAPDPASGEFVVRIHPDSRDDG
jgi:hypothetical protein